MFENSDAIKEIKIQDHVCSIHDDRKHSLFFAAAFLKFGLENWERCLYLGNLSEICAIFKESGIDEEYLHTNQLILISDEMWRGKELFLLKENVELAIKDGYRCLRVVHEMQPCEELLKYEAMLNDFYHENPALGLCLYVETPMLGSTNVELLLRDVKAHPRVYFAGMVCENTHYISPLERDVKKELHSYLGMLMDKALLKKLNAESENSSREIMKERTRKLQESRDAIFNMLKDIDESYKKLHKAYQELETLDKMKDEFISNVSHELKTPLISIKGYGELLFDEKLGSISGEQRKSLEAIIRNADRLTRMVNSLLLISRLQAGKIDFRFEPLDLDEIVRMCVSDLKGMIDARQIILEKDVTGVSKIKGDKDKLTEVITNLLDNSIKFTPAGGKISIKAWDEAEYVHITLSDSGIGIPADHIPKLFTRFYQVDASSSRKYGGTGLGLYISKNIVDALHGRIWIESEAGKGTTVHILLPVS